MGDILELRAVAWLPTQQVHVSGGGSLEREKDG